MRAIPTASLRSLLLICIFKAALACVSRALLVKIKRDLENQIRGLLKNLGLVIGRAKMNVFAVRAAELTEHRPELAAAVVPLLNARAAIEQQIADLDRKVRRLPTRPTPALSPTAHRPSTLMS